MKLIKLSIFLGVALAGKEEDRALKKLGTEDWTEGISVGTFGDRNVGMTAFNKLFSLSSTNIVRRLCSDCSSVAHREIYYKRLTPVPAGLSMYDLFYTTWGDITNRMHVDFDLYSSFDDALNEVNPWRFCNYNDPGVGFPRDCGPAGHVSKQWNTDRNSRHWAKHGPESYQFSINRVEGAFDSSWVIENLCGKHFYTKQISTSHENYAAAKTACVNVGAQLPDICSSADLGKLVKRYGLDWWVAANDIMTENDWRDFNGNVATGLPWASNEPNDQGGEDCVQVLSSGLNDQDCNEQRKYICVAEVVKVVSCMNDHWTYNEDTEQCEPDADLSSIACGSTDMTISIHKAFVYEEYDGDVPSKITIGNKDCTSTWDSDNMAVFKVNFNDECGQDIYHENGTISVSIDFDRSSSKEVDGVGIFTSNEDNMIWTFTCSYDDVISTKDSLEVSVSALIGATTLHTVFPADAFPMKLVNVDNPNDPIKNGDMTRLTIQMPEGFPKNLKLHFMTCTATADGDDSITIKMVKDGCALDVIDSADASTSENAISYTYTAFSFSEFGAMEIICDAKICLDSEVRKECMEMEDTCAEGYTDIF